MDLLREFYEENKDWLTPLVSSFLGALVGWFTSMVRTRTSRLTDLIDGKNVYDDNDLVLIPGTTDWVELGKLTICRKGKNADAKKN